MTVLANISYSFLLLLSAGFFWGCKQPRKIAPATTSPDYKKGVSLFNRNNDSAFYYFNKVTTSPGDSLQVAKAYTYMAIIQSDAGDHFGSQESLLQSLKLLDEKKKENQELLLSNYNELGYTSADLNNQDAAIGYYNTALQLVRNDSLRIVILNNKALAYQKKKQYDEALAIYRSILNESKSNGSEYARILTNMANAKWNQDATYNAAPELLTALQIRENERDSRGLNASYGHLSAYYFHSQPDSSLLYAQKMYAVASRNNSPDDQLYALQKLIALSSADRVKKYFARYQYLNDSLQTARNNAKNQFALIRYNAARNKAANLLLQKENEDKKAQIILQWFLLSGTVILAALLFFWYRKRKQQALRKQQLKTSQKVHDVVANGLYRIMTEVEYDETIEKESLLDRIEILYEQSRNISYESPEKNARDYNELIAGLLSSFSSSDIRVSVVGNSKRLWYPVKPRIRQVIIPVLQELMVNMKKHSKAKNVVIKFDQKDDTIIIGYIDDGIGFSGTTKYGNGLKNTESRITDIKGRVIFGAENKGGANIQLHIPIL